MKKFLLFVMALVATCAVASAQDTWTVAGDAAILNGTLSWDVQNTANDMQDDGEGYFYLAVTGKNLKAGSYEFKVCKNHGWDECYPSNNYVLNIAADGVYTIEYLFDAVEKDVIALETLESSDVQWDYYMKHPWGAGSDDSWAWKKLTATENEGVYSIVDFYGGIGVNWNTQASDANANWVPVNEISLEGDPQVGDECTFFLYTATPKAEVKIVKNAPVVKYYIKHGWGTGTDESWTWKELTATENEGEYFIVDFYGGTGCNWNTAATDENSTWIPDSELILLGNPQKGDEVVFYLYPALNSIEVVKDNSTAISDVTVAGTRIYKTIENGQVVIIRNGIRYNTLGVKM